MKRILMTLTVLLVVQLGLGAAIYYSGQTPLAGSQTEHLLALDPQQVTELQISSADQTLLLKKTGSDWGIDGHAGVPVDGGKVSALLSRLTAIKRPWPVAKSADTYKRFKVADDDFERKVILRVVDKDLATLLVGSSPGFRKVHARLAGEDEIFDVPFSSYEASLKITDWLDKKHFQVDPATVEAIELPQLLVVKKADGMQLEGLQDGEQTAVKPVEKLVQTIARLQIRDLHDGFPTENAVTIPVTLTLTTGKTISYTFAKSEKDDYALLRTEGSSQVYEVDQALWNEINSLKRADLITHQVPNEKSQAAPSAKDTN